MFNTVVESVRENMKAFFANIIAIFLLAIIPICIVVYGYFNFNINAALFTKDTNSIAGSPFYYGMLSNLGAVFWACAAAICFLGSNVVLFDEAIKTFFTWSFLFSSLLLFDDLFLLHEQILPVYLGISEVVWFGIYVLAMLVYIVKYRMILIRGPYLYFLLSVFFFGMSILIDIIPFEVKGEIIIEDGFKFLGIIYWMAFFYKLFMVQLRKS
ncbi:hypothetical protein [Hymenobacter sp. HDW8]|uniref:hypothetical protein n=1 Tax=Hymenobacter sp. HDW8 TaxID=2714932 RepID=UPI00140BE6B0|nr:hypothetical protein [Hymenobacter sp. HDW8]QIL75548.1 hypothetical protein G7064_06570 [Hymenobacter sp. HDW8]